MDRAGARHHVHRAGGRVHFAKAQGASSHPRSPKAECATQKRVYAVNVPVLELETLQQPACLELENPLAFPAAGSSKTTIQLQCKRMWSSPEVNTHAWVSTSPKSPWSNVALHFGHSESEYLLPAPPSFIPLTAIAAHPYSPLLKG